MDANTGVIVTGLTGCPVDLVLYDEGQTRLLKCEVVSPIPLQLKVLDKRTTGIRAGRRAMLLTHYNGIAVRADGHLDRASQGDGETFLDFGSVHWEFLERRRHIRVPVSIPIALRIVEQDNAAPEVKVIMGSTLDMSVSGAFVQVAELPPEGALVEFSTELDGEPVRTLAVVARIAAERSSVGLHFVEYLANSRSLLNEFLEKSA